MKPTINYCVGLAYCASVISTSLFLFASPANAQTGSQRVWHATNRTEVTPTPNQGFIYRDEDGELGLNVVPMAEGVWGTGNWFGLRRKLVDTGVDITGSYASNILGNVAGGKKRGISYADQFHLQVDLDFQKLIGWQGAHFVVSAIDRNGTNVSQQFTGNIFNPNQIYGSPTLQLYNIFLEQNLLDGLINIKLGRMAATEHFATSPIYGLYVNNGIDGQPMSLISAGYLTTWPSATWGGRIRFENKTKTLYAMAGLYQTHNRLFKASYHGMDFSIRPHDGMVMLGEVGWSPEFQPHPVSDISVISDKKDIIPSSNNVKWHGMPGHYKIGGFYTYWPNIPTFDNRKADGTYGFYFLADQMVYQAKPGSASGLTLWSAFVYIPNERTSNIPFQVSGGAFYTGLIPGRSKDKTAIQITYGGLGRDYARAQEMLGNGYPTYEIVLEAAYTIQLSKALRVQPDVQYIIRPGGTGNIPNALLIGAQIGFNF